MKIGILGGGGCFALNFARMCIGKHVDFFGIGRSAPKHPALWLAPDNYRYYVHHLVDNLPDALEILDFEQPDIIVNFAAQGEGGASFGENAPLFYRTNCEGLVRMVQELKKRRYLNLFVHISTSELYGSNEQPVAEDAPLKPTSPYAISKAAFDQHLQAIGRVDGFPFIILRPSNCYTPGQQLWRIIPRTFIAALYGVPMILKGGSALKSFLHADDLSRAIFKVLMYKPVGRIFNVGPTLCTSIEEVVWKVFRYCDREKDFKKLVTKVPPRLGEDQCYVLDSTEIGKLGWKQTINWKEGLKTMYDWVRSYPELASLPHTFIMRP